MISPRQDRVFARDLAADREAWSRDFTELSLARGLWASQWDSGSIVSLGHESGTLHLDPATGETIKAESRYARHAGSTSYAGTRSACRITDLMEGIENCEISGPFMDWPIAWNGRVGAIMFHSEGRPRNRASKHRCNRDFALYDALGVEQFSLAEATRVGAVQSVCRDDERGDFKLAFRELGTGPIKVGYLGDLKDFMLPGRDVGFGIVSSFLSPRYLITTGEVIDLG
ncbi:hypothetical protein [Luteolibacter sp. Populi]|uniref:hypothetical protein n=1 Tax=Luteolibacter sp. Populi TaxID=3230487 RepID=UPI003467503D